MQSSAEDSRKKRYVGEVDKDGMEQRLKKVKSDGKSAAVPVSAATGGAATTVTAAVGAKSSPLISSLSKPASPLLSPAPSPIDRRRRRRDEVDPRRHDQCSSETNAASSTAPNRRSSPPTQVPVPSQSKSSRNDRLGSKICARLAKNAGADLESVLHHICKSQQATKEYISKRRRISFAVGHSGDVSKIAQLYREVNSRRNDNELLAASKGRSSGTLQHSASMKPPSSKVCGTKTKKATTTATITSSQLERDTAVAKSPSKSTPSSSSSLRPKPALSSTIKSTDPSATTVKCTKDRSSSSLDMWLADGMGDEDHPPSVFALLVKIHDEDRDDDIDTRQEADIDVDGHGRRADAVGAVGIKQNEDKHCPHTKKTQQPMANATRPASTIELNPTQATARTTTAPQSSRLVGVALMSHSIGKTHQRILRVEWLYIDPKLDDDVSSSIIQKRMWLRLASVALMTSCQDMVVVKEHTPRTLA